MWTRYVALIAGGFGIAAPAAAQVAAWGVPVYAELALLPPGGESSTVRFEPWLSARMQEIVLTAGNSPGLVLAGGAQTAPQQGYFVPQTAYVAKVSPLDGHVLWSWQSEAENVQGVFMNVASDSQGAVVLMGNSAGRGAEVAKLSADGNLLWRTDAGPQTQGFGVAVDANDDVLATIAAGFTQVVSKYSGIDGSLLWTNALAAAYQEWDDFMIVLDADGNAIIGGAYADPPETTPQEVGSQIGKSRNSDGALEWSKRIVNPNPASWGYSLSILRSLPDGSALALTSDRLERLRSNDGATVWQNMRDTSTVNDILADGSGRIFTTGQMNAADGFPVAYIARFDADSGNNVWTVQLPQTSTWTFGDRLLSGHDGHLLLVSTDQDDLALHYYVSSIEPTSGALVWSVGMGRRRVYEGSAFGIVQTGEGSILVGAFGLTGEEHLTWNIFKVTGPFSDDFFANGNDG